MFPKLKLNKTLNHDLNHHHKNITQLGLGQLVEGDSAMKELLFSQMGFWSAFTILFIFAAMGYFIYKVAQLSSAKQKK